MSDLGSTASDIYRNVLSVIEGVEPRIAAATRAELTDQRASLKLIASENYASPAVLLTMGTWLSDKYAEGTVGHRFYAGCQNVDEVESIAAEHARELFGAPYAYVQPHSGIDANLVAFWAILATRVEAPALTEAGVRGVNDLSEAEWERLRARLGSQRLKVGLAACTRAMKAGSLSFSCAMLIWKWWPGTPSCSINAGCSYSGRWSRCEVLTIRPPEMPSCGEPGL